METSMQIVLGMPGLWPTRSDIVQAVASKSGGLMLVGDHLFDPVNQHMFDVDIYDPDPGLRQAFALAGRLSLSAADLDAIASHSHTFYLIGPGGSLDAACTMMVVASGILKAGGIAIKVESAGVAHSASDWIALAQDQHPSALYRAYVVLIGGSGEYYSCGMHCLGLRDAILSDRIGGNDAARLLGVFLLYLLIEQPVLHSGETFSLNPTSPRYRLSEEPCTTFPADHLFHNPFGMWRLSPA